MISLVILLIILAPSLTVQNEKLECKSTWVNKDAFYKYRDSQPETGGLLNPLLNENLFNNKGYELCRKLNNSLYVGYELEDFYYNEYGDETFDGHPTYVFPVSFDDIETGNFSTSDLVTKQFSFSYFADPNFDGKEAIINITTKVPKNVCISELTEGGNLGKIFPIRYKVSQFTTIKSSERYHHLVEGERCKGEYNDETKKLENKVCWSHPYFCRGTRFECLINDDIDTFCYDSGTGEGQKLFNPKEIPYSVYIGELIYWKHPLSIYAVTGPYADIISWPQYFFWNCTDLGNDVLCDYVFDGPRPGLTFLKTWTGYAG